MNRRKKPKKLLYPTASERAYRFELLSMVKYMRMLVEERLIKKISELGNAIDKVKTDSAADELDQIISGIKFSVGARYPANRRQQMALEAAESVSKYGKKQFTDKVLTVNNLPIPNAEPYLADWIDSFTYVNTRLIQDVGEKAANSVHQIVSDGVLNGRMTSEISAEIRKAMNTTEDRADFIARDQVGKLNGQLNGVRQQKAGIDSYIWRTVGDERVRDNHASKDGKKFSWDDPPDDTGHPGEDYNCRCWPEPFIEGLESDDDEED